MVHALKGGTIFFERILLLIAGFQYFLIDLRIADEILSSFVQIKHEEVMLGGV